MDVAWNGGGPLGSNENPETFANFADPPPPHLPVHLDFKFEVRRPTITVARGKTLNISEP